MKILIYLVYLFTPLAIHSFVQLTYGTRIKITDYHAIFSELGVSIALLYGILKGKIRGLEYWLLIIGFFALCIADTIFSETLPLQLEGRHIITYFSESLYTVFLVFLSIYVTYKLKELLKEKISLALVLLLSSGFAYISFKYILIPFYTRDPSPMMFHIINSTIYGIVACFLMGIIGVSIFRSNRQIEHAFLQTMLLMCVSDFAIRFQTAMTNSVHLKWYSNVWEIAMASYFMLTIFDNLQLRYDSMIKSYISIRTLLTIAISAGMTIFTAFVIYMNFYYVGNAFQLTDILLVAYVICLVSNLISIKLSDQILEIDQLLYASSLNYDPKKLRNENDFSFRSIDRFSHLFEIDKILKQYNELTIKANDLLKLLAQKSKLATIGQTTAMVAHDVRKPLSSMKALLTMLPQIKNNPQQVNMIAAEVDSAISRTNTMLNDILIFSRDSSAIEKKECDAQSIIKAAISESLRAKDNLNVSFEYNLDHHNYLFADYDGIIRVLTNIIGNAIEAMNGEGKIWIQTSDLNSCILKIVIGNDGPEIPQKILETIFEPFVTHGKKGGTGLGMAICKNIIEKNDGQISVSSRNRSTEFNIFLPSKEGNVEIDESQLIKHSNELKLFRKELSDRSSDGDSINTEEFMRLHKEHGKAFYLLILDDEPLFRESIRSLVKTTAQIDDCLKIVECGSAKEALGLFNSQKFDYVISDIDLGTGRMNGYEFSKKVLKQYPDTYLLIHSNKRREEMDNELRTTGNSRFMGFLPKPMNETELLQFLARKTFEAKGEGLIVQGEGSKELNDKKSVLILNDDDALLLTFKILLKSSGVKVYTATTVADAIKQMKDTGADVIISDINLGKNEPSGYEFLKEIRKKDKDIPFYMVSGYSYSDEAPKAEKMGASGYLQLPIDKEQLISVVQ